jgi:hypothetical protein
MATGKSQSDPLDPPAKAHTVPLPPKPKPAAKETAEEPAPQKPAPVAVEPVQGHAMPLEAVDREIADEADRLMEGGEALAGDVHGEHVPPVQAGQVEDPVTPATADAPLQDDAAMEKGEQVPEQIEDAPAMAAANVVEPAQPQPPQPMPDNASVPADEPEQPAASQPTGPSWLTKVVCAAVAAVKAMLLVLNYPMRLLPDSAKTFFNWFAISLLLWVPAIWFIALFVI